MLKANARAVVRNTHIQESNFSSAKMTNILNNNTIRLAAKNAHYGIQLFYLRIWLVLIF
jgi:hypothetical protein